MVYVAASHTRCAEQNTVEYADMLRQRTGLTAQACPESTGEAIQAPKPRMFVSSQVQAHVGW